MIKIKIEKERKWNRKENKETLLSTVTQGSDGALCNDSSDSFMVARIPRIEKNKKKARFLHREKMRLLYHLLRVKLMLTSL